MFIICTFTAYLMTPRSVIEFLKSNRLIMPDLPAPLSETPFHTIKTLKGIIDYCMKEEELIYNLDDLPFGKLAYLPSPCKLLECFLKQRNSVL